MKVRDYGGGKFIGLGDKVDGAGHIHRIAIYYLNAASISTV